MYTVYSKPMCPDCMKAKALLQMKKLEYVEIHLDVGQEKIEGIHYITRDELKAKLPDAKVMPQILKDGIPIGSYYDLSKLI